MALSITQRLRLALGIEKSAKPKQLTHDELKRIQSMQLGVFGNIMSAWQKKKNIPQHRLALYKAYDELDDVVPEIGGFLDTVASEATQLNEQRGHKLWPTCKNKKVLERIEDLLYRKLKVDDWTTSTIRSLAKYGDDFGEVLYNDKSVEGIFWGVPLTEIVRFETAAGQLLGYAMRTDVSQHLTGSKVDITKDKIQKHISKPWDFVHFRIMVEKRYNAHDPMPVLYGTSMLRRAIRPAYRLDTIHDLLLMYRASKAIDRLLLKIDVTGQTPDEQYETLMKWKKWLYQLSYENRDDGEFKTMGNPLAIGEDIIWPVTDNSNSDIDTISGNPNLYEAFDVDMAVNQFYGALSAPKGIFGYEDRLEGDKPYASQSIQFAKLTFKLQGSFMAGVNWIIRTDLALGQEELKLSDEDLVSPDLFNLHMVPPSAILHLHRLEAMRDVVDAARDMLDLASDLEFDEVTGMEWKVHVLRSIIGMTDFDIEHFADALEKRIKELKKELKQQEREGEPEPQISAPEQPPEGEEEEGEEEESGEEETSTEQLLETIRTTQQHSFLREDLPPRDFDGDKDHTGEDRLIYPIDMFEKNKSNNKKDPEGGDASKN